MRLQAIQRAVGQGFGIVDQVLGGGGHVARVAGQPLGGGGCGGGGAAQQVADLRQGVFEAEVVVHAEGRRGGGLQLVAQGAVEEFAVGGEAGWGGDDFFVHE